MFLMNRAGDPDGQAAAALAEELGGLPLALEQAAAYINATGITLAGYLSMFEGRRPALLARGEAAGHPADVATTLGLALSRLETDDPAAVDLLRLLACLAPDPVPLALLLTDTQTTGAHAPDAAARVESLLTDPLAIRDTIAALRRYSLVTPAGDDTVLVHRLVQVVIRGQAPTDAIEQWSQTAATLVDAAIPEDTRSPAAWPVCAVLLPHARAVLGLTSTGIWQIAQYLGFSGSYLAARDLFGRITAAHDEHADFGPEHPRTLAARYILAYWTGQAGDAPSARDQFAALLPAREQILGAEHPDTLTTRHNLASWTGQAGDAVAARDQFASVLPITERVLGPEHPDTLATRHSLAYWTGQAGDAAVARDQLAALLPLTEQVLGPEHPHTLTTRHSLAHFTRQAENADG
jgi:hypothetical protein